MRRIINGKAYDTDTAKQIAKYDNGLLPDDFDYIEETLYLKKTGEYFILGEGGARSKYSVTTFVPITEESAKKWVEEKANGLYEEIFGECEE